MHPTLLLHSKNERTATLPVPTHYLALLLGGTSYVENIVEQSSFH